MSESNLLIISNNVRGLNIKKKRQSTMQILLKDKPDILFMQETRLHKLNSIRDIKQSYANYHVYANLENSAKLGLLTFIKKSLDVKIIVKSVSSKHFFKIQIKNKNDFINLYNVHMPHRKNERIRILDIIKKEIIKDPVPSILGGDWNMANKNESDALLKWASFMNFKEIKSTFENANNIEIPTFTRGNSQSRLDRIFITKRLKTLNLHYLINPYSDHIGMKFSIPFSNLGTSLASRRYGSFLSFKPKWWMLEDKEIIRIMNQSVNSLLEYSLIFPPHIYWNIVKLSIKQKIFELQKTTIQSLFDKFDRIEKEITNVINFQFTNPKLLQDKKNEMIKLMTKLNKIQRPHSNDIYQDNNMIFLKQLYNKYKKANNSPMFERLIDPQSKNNIIQDGQKIAEILKDEYLRRSESSNLTKNTQSNFFPETGLNKKFFKKERNKLTLEIQDSINSLPSLEEFKTALKDKTHSQLPGPDGLNSIFYNLANDEIFNLAYKAKIDRINYDFSDPSIHPISAILFPIPKRSSMGENVSWNKVAQASQIRFIALINSDDKAWDRILNTKLNSVLPLIVHRYCFSAPRRNLQQAVLLAEFLSNKKNIKNNNKTSIIKLDFKNAFDLTSQRHLLKYLHDSIGSGWLYEQITRSITNRKILVKYGNFTSKKIVCSVGILQGCPLSASLYTMYMDILANKIIKFNRGIQIGESGSTIKVMHFIDDIIITCRDDADVQMAWKIVKDFCLVTGAILNKSKSQTLPIFLKTKNISRESKMKVNKLLSSSKLYGFYPFGDQKENSRKTFKRILEQIDTQIANQSIHLSSLSNKTKIINTMFTSKLIYFLPLLEITENMIKQYMSKCSKFLWKGFIQVPMKLITLPKQHGGLGLIHLKNISISLKLNFYVKLGMNNSIPTPVMKILSEYYYRKHIKNDFFLNKIKSTISNTKDQLHRVKHSDVVSIIANLEGYKKLPFYFYRHVKTLKDSGGLKTFIFKLLWNRLPTSFHLRNNRHISSINDTCQSCSRSSPETLQHIMNECDNAIKLKNQIYQEFKIPVASLSDKFDVSLWKKKTVGMQFLSLLIMQSLWKERNDRLFGNIAGVKTPMMHFKTILKENIKSIKKCFFPKKLRNQVLSMAAN